MDNFTHGFFGACLSKAGLDRFTPRATLTLVIASNLPDIDALASFLGQDTMFHLRRGWTHGVIAQAVLPWLLAGAMVRLGGRRDGGHDSAPRFLPTLALAYLGVLGHVFMDWLNTYGIRLLMPVDDLWRYGDSLFIVDPWVWLVAGAPLFLAHSASRGWILFWSVFGGGASMLMLATAEVPPLARLLWFAGLATVVAARVRGGPRSSVRAIAFAASVLVAGYIAGMKWGSVAAVRRARDYAREKNIAVVDIAPMPVPADSFRREVVLATATTYHRLRVDLLDREPAREIQEPTPRGESSPPVRAALRTIPGTAHWLRYPYYRVENVPEGYLVSIRDFRYSGRGRRELGRTDVRLDHQLNPR